MAITCVSKYLTDFWISTSGFEGTIWISKLELQDRLLESLTDGQYDEWVSCMERLSAHPSHKREKDFINTYRKPLSSQNVQKVFPPVLLEPDGRQSVKVEGKGRPSNPWSCTNVYYCTIVLIIHYAYYLYLIFDCSLSEEDSPWDRNSQNAGERPLWHKWKGLGLLLTHPGSGVYYLSPPTRRLARDGGHPGDCDGVRGNGTGGCTEMGSCYGNCCFG